MQQNYTDQVSPEMRSRLGKIRHVALDMDGTIYLGSRLFPFTISFLELLSRNGIGYSFLTNNPTKSVKDYLRKLSGMGIHATEDNMYTTSVAAIDYIKAHFPGARRLFLLGTPSMVSQFREAGFEECSDSPDDVPEVLVGSFDMTLTYARLCRAAWWASRGIPYIATNPDKVCPSDERTILVDCGSICKCIEYATGRKPDVTLGKPDPNMLQGIIRRHGLEPDERIKLIGEFHDWFRARTAQYGGENCENIERGDPQNMVTICPGVIMDSYEKCVELLEERGLA